MTEQVERRRQSWREFRLAYPGIITVLFVALVSMVAIDGWLVYQRVRYAREIARLRASMTDQERRKADMVIAAEQNRTRVALELMRRQANIDKDLHISVAVDSGVMYLERDGALLREMAVDVGSEKRVGTAPDTLKIVAPRGARTVERVLGANDRWEIPKWVYLDRGLPAPADRMVAGALGAGAIVLSGGAVIYTHPTSGPLSDTTYVMPGAIRARVQDLRAIAPNLTPGMSVYLY
ncbi:MAG TPA: hypothetical protein VL308_03095 [Gemmatimonadaceae bacterium]|nr:hypothetical protein [Gemmatimonadaceae bacterium]